LSIAPDREPLIAPRSSTITGPATATALTEAMNVLMWKIKQAGCGVHQFLGTLRVLTHSGLKMADSPNPRIGTLTPRPAASRLYSM
jgi:hypothetical protein